MTVANVGDQDATGVIVTDLGLNGATFVDAPATVDVGAGAQLTDGRVVWPAFDLAAGGNVVLTVIYHVDTKVPAGLELLTNIATVDDDHDNGIDPNTDDNATSDIDALIAVPDLVVTKTDGVTNVRPGDTLTYTVMVAGVGDQDSSGVVTTDRLPIGTDFVSATGSGALAAGVVTWPARSIRAGETVVYTVIVTVAAPFIPTLRQIDNVASAGDDRLGGLDPTPSNNSATDSDAVDNEAVAPISPIPTTGAEVTRLVVPAVLLIGGGIALLVGARRPRTSRRRVHARRSLI